MRDIEQIDWSQVLLAQTLVERAPLWVRLSRTARTIGSAFFRRSIPPVQVDAGAMLCLRSMVRSDYDVLWSKVMGSIPQKKQEVEIVWPRGFSLDPIKRLRHFGAAWNAAKCNEGFLDHIVGTVMCLYYLDAIDVFRRSSPQRVLVLAEMQPGENALIQYFNARGVPTATLQHGLYIDYGAQQTVNRLNYEASCAQTFLAWGEETGELMRGHHSNVEIVVCGAPQIDGVIVEQGPECIYVVFDADINYEENRILLKVGKRLGLESGSEIIVCLHPCNKHKLYNFNGCSFLSPADNYSRSGVVIGHTTTQIIKLACYGKRVFKLKSAQPCNRMIPESVRFSDYEDLASKIAQATYPHAWAQAHIAYMGSESLSRYAEFFNRWFPDGDRE
tara:strand:- start:344 stop:1507 length:1164 start_codon:yes stop_codon:yes gene_type:complete